MSKEGKRTIILDSSAIINGYNPASTTGNRHIITEKAVEEIIGERARNRLQMAVELKKTEITKPKEEEIKKIKEEALKTGDLKYLSKADIETLAAALEVKENGDKPIIMTDDFTIQNLAEYLGIRYTSIATMGIKRRIEWKTYCQACGRTFKNPKLKRCPICGTPLKRKPNV